MIKVGKMNEQINKLVEKNKKNFVFNSIIEGLTYGEIYVDHLESPELYVVFDGGNFVLYVGGETKDELKYKRCMEFIKTDILSFDLKNKFDDHILVNWGSEIIKKNIKTTFNDMIVHEGERSLYRYQEKQLKIQIPFSGYEIKEIDESLLKSKLINNEDLIEEIFSMWGSIDMFLVNGFGTCAIRENELLAWCTAEFMSKFNCGIGIETIEKEQGKKIGTSVANKFIELSLSKNKTPYWDSWLKNVPSVKTAEKIGFTKIEDYEVVVIKF